MIRISIPATLRRREDITSLPIPINRSERDEFRQRLECNAEPIVEPHCRGDEWENEDRAGDGGAEGEDAGHADLEEDEADDDAGADHGPGAAGGMLTVVHGVEELVFVDEGAHDEVDQAEEADEPGPWENGVDDANDEDEDGLREVEAVAEGWGVLEIRIVYCTN